MMSRFGLRQTFLVLLVLSIAFGVFSCKSSDSSDGLYGKTVPPKTNVLRYITGSEPRTLDPQISTAQTDARIYVAIYDGLVDYHPKDMSPIPSIAEKWEVKSDGTEYLFYLRKNAKFSDGTPITAKDFVYSFRRGLSPELASENATLGFMMKYAEPYNSASVFLKKPDGNFLLASEMEEDTPDEASAQTQTPKVENFGTETEFHKFITSPARFTLKGEPFDRAKDIEKDDKLRGFLKFTVKDLKNANAFAKKVKEGSNGFYRFVSQNISDDAINACASDNCSDAHKQAIVDGLNKILNGENAYEKLRFEGTEMPKDSQKFLDKINKENEKRAKDNLAIDEEISKATDDAVKQAKEKTKKKPIEKLFYFNKFLLEEFFPDELEKSPFVEVKGEDMGVEAVEDYTLRITLERPTPYFVGLLAHQLYRVVPQHAIEKYGKDWVRPENIITSGSFKVVEHKPYHILTVAKDENNWDKDNVKLDGIEFYPLEETTTMMNLYKTGDVDALYNHTMPAAWIDDLRPQIKREYLLYPEAANEFYTINIKKPPMDNLKVRQAFALGIDRVALSKFRKITKPLVDFTPNGIFPEFDEARKKVQAEKLKELKIDENDWNKRIFDPEKARKLLAEAGFPVEGSAGNYSCPKFPVDKVNITYNTAESNQKVAEFVQAQWKQNLGITVPLKNLEFKTFLPMLNKVEYDGFGRRGWVADYMDPFTYLDLFYTEANNGATGWTNKDYDKLLTKANATVDQEKRNELLAQAEFMVMQQQIIIPLAINATSWMKKPYVKGLYPNPATLHAWKFVYIERDPNKWDTDADKVMTEKDPIYDAQLEKLQAVQKAFEAEKKGEQAKNTEAK